MNIELHVGCVIFLGGGFAAYTGMKYSHTCTVNIISMNISQHNHIPQESCWYHGCLKVEEGMKGWTQDDLLHPVYITWMDGWIDRWMDRWMEWM